MHTRSATCVKAAGNLPGPTICQQMEGTQRDKGKHSNGRSRGERDPLSAAVLCRLVEQILLWPPMEPQTPRLGPAHHLPSADGHSGSRCFWQIFYGNTETEIPAAASTPSVPQSRVAFAKKEEIPAPGDRRTLEIAHFDRLRNLGGRPRQGFKK